MLDPSRIQEAVRQLQQLLESVSGDQLEDTLRGVRTTMESLQQQVAQSEVIRRNLEAARRGITSNISNLSRQKDQVDAQLRALQSRRTDANSRAQQNIRDAYRSGDITRILRAEEGRLRILDAYARRMRQVRSLQGQLTASLAGANDQLNRVNTAYTQQGNLLRRNRGQLVGARQQHSAIRQLLHQQNSAAKTFSSLLGVSHGTTLALAKTLGSVRSVIFAIAKFAVGQIVGGFNEARKAGQSAGQAIETSIQAIAASTAGLANGVIASPQEFAKNLAALQNQLGQMDIAAGLTVEATRLTTQYGVATDAAVGIVSQVERLNRFQSSVTANQIKQALTLSRIKGMAPGAVFAEVAKNTQYMARYANQGLVAFANSAIELRKMGVEMSSIEGFADKMVGDLEGALRTQASIQTIAPGFDLMPTLALSEFGGTPEQIAASLKSALQAAGITDLSKLSRSRQNSLASDFGMDLTTLSNLLSGKSAAASVNKNVVPEEVAGFANSIANNATPALQLLAAAATTAATALFAQSAGSALRGLRGAGGAAGAGRLAGGVARSGIARLAGASGIAAGVIGGAGQYMESKAQGMASSAALKNAAIVGGGGAVGAMGGAAVGAMIGSIIPGAGTIVGGAVGALVSMIGGYAGTQIARRFTTVMSEEQKKLGELQTKEAIAQQERITRMTAPLAKFTDTVAITNRAMLEHGTLWSRMRGMVGSGFRSTADFITGERKHSGGIVGSGSKMSIPRFHKGMMPDEVPAILQRGEAVLSKTQLGGLTKLMNVAKELGKVGDSFKQIKPESLNKLATGLGSFSSLFSGGSQGIGNKIGQAVGKMVGSKAGGALSGLLGGKTGTALSGVLSGKTSVTSALTGLLGGSKGIGNKIAGFFGGKAGGQAATTISGVLSGKTSIGGALSSTLSGVLGKSGIGSKLTGFLGGKTGGFIGAGAKLLKGDVSGALKGLGTGALAKLGGAKIGGMIGSVIPGAGTIVGSLVGAGISKLANTKVGKAVIGTVGKVLGKTPLAAVGKKVGGAIKKIGGWFGKKKKATPVPTPQQQVATDIPENQSGMYMSQQMIQGGGGYTGGAAPASTTVNVDMKPLEQKLEHLINLMQNGGIVVNLDGKKVGGGLVDAYSRG